MTLTSVPLHPPADVSQVASAWVDLDAYKSLQVQVRVIISDTETKIEEIRRSKLEGFLHIYR